MCTFSNHESMVYCEMCGVFRETFVKSAKDGPLKGIQSRTWFNHSNSVYKYARNCNVSLHVIIVLSGATVVVSNEPRTSAASKIGSAKTPVKTRALDSDGDSARKHVSMSSDKGIIGANLHHLYILLMSY